MKKLYIDIRFAKCILALTAGWLMAGCSAEDELGNGSAAQQLSMTPMVNDLQTTRVKEEENLHEKTLSSLDFKMFEPTMVIVESTASLQVRQKTRQRYWLPATGRRARTSCQVKVMHSMQQPTPSRTCKAKA